MHKRNWGIVKTAYQKKASQAGILLMNSCDLLICQATTICPLPPLNRSKYILNNQGIGGKINPFLNIGQRNSVLADLTNYLTPAAH